MPRVKISHEIECDEDTFWKVFLDKDFNDKLYKGALKFPEFVIEEQTETDSEVKRRTRGRPHLAGIPGPIAKLLGDNFGYVETGSMDKKQRIWRWKLVPSVMSDKVKQEGEMRIEKIGDTKVRRNVEFLIEAKVFGLGGMLESTTEKQLRDGWDTSAKFMNKYLGETK